VSGASTRFSLNTGTASSPAFAAPTINPFGLTNVPATQNHSAPDFVDIDGDGDFDALVGTESGGIALFGNTGTASAPAFAAPTLNPFGLTNVGFFLSPTFADADGDGDLDAWVGHSGDTILLENTGSATAPAFAAPVTNPFGVVFVGFGPAPAFADIDADSDLDLFAGASEERVFFFENVAIDPDACTDGLDNDGDGQLDLGADPGCASAADTSELGTKQCDNGQDGDGKVDWRSDASGDPHCASLTDNREAPDPPTGCGLGPELLLLGPVLAAVRRRRRSYTAPSCPSPTPPPTSSSSGSR
jgi:hypothetical protein